MAVNTFVPEHAGRLRYGQNRTAFIGRKCEIAQEWPTGCVSEVLAAPKAANPREDST